MGEGGKADAVADADEIAEDHPVEGEDDHDEGDDDDDDSVDVVADTGADLCWL